MKYEVDWSWFASSSSSWKAHLGSLPSSGCESGFEDVWSWVCHGFPDSLSIWEWSWSTPPRTGLRCRLMWVGFLFAAEMEWEQESELFSFEIECLLTERESSACEEFDVACSTSLERETFRRDLCTIADFLEFLRFEELAGLLLAEDWGRGPTGFKLTPECAMGSDKTLARSVWSSRRLPKASFTLLG